MNFAGGLQAPAHLITLLLSLWIVDLYVFVLKQMRLHLKSYFPTKVATRPKWLLCTNDLWENRALTLYSGGPWFKFSFLPLAGLLFGSL